jgi:hypothetical protein
MATCSAETVLSDAATSGFTKLAERNKLDVVLQLLCDISAGGGSGGSSDFLVAVSDEYVALTAGANKLRFRMPYAMELTEVRAHCNTAPTGGPIEVDINAGGVSILSQIISIDAGDTTSLDAGTQPAISTSSLTDDQQIAIDVDAVGSTVAGAGLKVVFIGDKA